ncbi:MAG: restriction endonuclease subunit S [Nitrospira sp.]|nr:restriction endonuclease subunit S [Nitrospira sp.]
MSAVRDIEFTQIAADWNVITLGEENPQALLAIRNGLTTKQDQGSGDYKVSRIETIGDGWIDDTRVRFASDLKEKDVEKYRIQRGDILFSHINSDPHLGKTGFAERDYEDLLHGMNLLLIRANPAVFDAEFLNRVFQYYRDIGVFVSICSRSVNQSSINQAKLKAVEVPLPPLPEQKKIAHILSTVQRAIEAQERIIQTTTELKKALMHKLFTEGLRNEPQKQTEIGPVPESWEVVPFDKFVTLQRGYDLRKQDFRKGEVPVIGATQVIGYHDTANVKAPGVTVVRSGSSAGKPLFIAEDFWAHNVLLYVKDFQGNVPKFVYYKILALDLTQYRQGVAVPTLNRNTFSAIELALPSPEEQQEIAYVLDAVGNKTEIAERKRDQLQDLFRTLLHELMTAKTRVHKLDLGMGTVA